MARTKKSTETSLTLQQKRTLLYTFCKQQIVKAKIQNFINNNPDMSKEEQMLYIAEHIKEFWCDDIDEVLIKIKINEFEKTCNQTRKL